MSALTLIAEIQGLAQNYIFRIWPDVRFQGQSRRESRPSQRSACSHNRTSSGASEVQNRVYGKPPLKQLIRPQEYCGTGTGAKDVRKSVHFRTRKQRLMRSAPLPSYALSQLLEQILCIFQVGVSKPSVNPSQMGLRRSHLLGPTNPGGIFCNCRKKTPVTTITARGVALV